MSSFVLGSRVSVRTGHRRVAGLRKSRRLRIGLELLEDRITPSSAPTVTGLNPTFGPSVGGTAVTITGTNFTGATVVDFGTNEATNLTVVNDTTITADSPAGAGTVDVTVTTPDGTSPTNLADEFTYSPTITVISPTSGPVGGGTTVTITGTSFTGATEVDFGTTAAASYTVVNNTTITAVSPAGIGVVDITIVAPTGTSATTPADRFTYAAAPVVSGVAPGSGSLAGGTLVTIIGSGFTGATLVNFGTLPATNLTVVSDSSITVHSPASLNTGTVDVTVMAPGGTSATSPADQFTYVAGPTVTGLSPTFGPSVGGTFVTITGTGFTGATVVDFGTTPATSVTVGRPYLDHRLQPRGRGHRQCHGDDSGRYIADCTRGRIYLFANGHGRQPSGRSVRRRHDGDDHRDQFRRSHRGRLRRDAGDQLHRRQQYDDHGRQSGGHRHREYHRYGAQRHVDRDVGRSLQLPGLAHGLRSEPGWRARIPAGRS